MYYVFECDLNETTTIAHRWQIRSEHEKEVGAFTTLRAAREQYPDAVNVTLDFETINAQAQRIDAREAQSRAESADLDAGEAASIVHEQKQQRKAELEARLIEISRECVGVSLQALPACAESAWNESRNAIEIGVDRAIALTVAEMSK